jgi:Protein of unknown function (DUF1499)
VPRSAGETFELVLQAIGKLKMRSAFEAPPGEEPGAPGVVEVADRTMVFGFTDDVAIRITGDEKVSRVDARSASRFGRSDFGRNAERVRAILKEISARLEASVPGIDTDPGQKAKSATKPASKRPREGNPASAARRLKSDPSRSNARRAPVRKVLPQE